MAEEEQEQSREQEQQELYEHHRMTVDIGQAPMRIDRFLNIHLPNVSRNKIQAATAAGCILVNDQPVKQNYRVKPQDRIVVLLPEPPQEFEMTPEQMDLNIVYEDDEVIVVDKPAGLVVHPAIGNWTGTLVNGLMYHLGYVPYLVHRIDKDTSGLLLVAKTEDAQTVLAKQFFVHSIERLYRALVWGDFNEDSGTIEGNIGRSIQDRRMFCIYPHEEGVPEEEQKGKHAVTHWRVVERFGYVTLVECRLETGRTHQIRVHMKHIGHPLFNDSMYGGNAILKGTTFSHYKQFVENCFHLMPRQALHAWVLGFEHPRTGEHMHFESPMPPDFAACLDKWRNYVETRNN